MTRTPSDTDTQSLHGEAGPRSFLKSHTHWHPRARDASDTPGLDGAVSAAGRPPGCTAGGPQHTVHKGELSSESLVFYREMFLEHTARGRPRAAGPRPPAAASASRVRVGSDFTANLKFHFIKPRSSCLLGTRDKCHKARQGCALPDFLRCRSPDLSPERPSPWAWARPAWPARLPGSQPRARSEPGVSGADEVRFWGQGLGTGSTAEKWAPPGGRKGEHRTGGKGAEGDACRPLPGKGTAVRCRCEAEHFLGFFTLGFEGSQSAFRTQMCFIPHKIFT